MIIKCGTDSNIIVSNKSIRHVLKSRYRVKFLNCYQRVAQKFEEFRPCIIKKKDTFVWVCRVIHV